MWWSCTVHWMVMYPPCDGHVFSLLCSCTLYVMLMYCSCKHNTFSTLYTELLQPYVDDETSIRPSHSGGHTPQLGGTALSCSPIQRVFSNQVTIYAMNQQTLVAIDQLTQCVILFHSSNKACCIHKRRLEDLSRWMRTILERSLSGCFYLPIASYGNGTFNTYRYS